MSLHAEDLVALVAGPARADGPAVGVPDRDGPVAGELVVVVRRGGWRSRVAEPARARGAGVDAGLDAVALVAEPSRADGPLPADAGAVAGGGGGDWESEAHLAGTPVSQRAAARERLGRSMMVACEARKRIIPDAAST